MFPYILQKDEARELGIKFFYSGRPCKNGHHSPRYTRTHMCLDCRRMHENARIRRDPAAHSAKGRGWYAANREKAVARTIAYNSKNKEAHRARALEWQRQNPERVRVNNRNRRALVAIRGRHTVDDVRAIFRAQKGRCAYCSVPLKGGKFHVDHIAPLARGGSNGRRNLQILCAPCNQSKSAKDPIVFARSRGMLL